MTNLREARATMASLPNGVIKQYLVRAFVCAPFFAFLVLMALLLATVFLFTDFVAV